jgi:PKD repeat protein
MIMKKSKQWNFLAKFFALSLVGALLVLPSCKEDEPEPAAGDPVASFQFTPSETNFLEVSFTDFSQNATEWAWDFDDGGTSVEQNPTHVFAAAGTFTVSLVVKNADGVASAAFTRDVTITDPLAAQRALVGDAGKTWMLLADASTGVNTFQVGPEDRSAVWWAFGGVEELCVRECILDDTWFFNTDGTYTFENNGDFWGEGGIWPDGTDCFDATDAANWIGKDGQDLSGWDSGTHNFEYNPSAQTLTVTGGFIGLTKAATDSEVTEPQTSVTYKVIKLVDEENGVDTLVVETALPNPGYWQFTLVSYDNPADKVVVGECAAVEEANVTFKVNMNDYTEAFTQVYVSGSAGINNWSGDAWPMADDDADGIWELTKLVPVGDHQYKFTLDNWAAQESFTSVIDGCTVQDGEFFNRALTVAGDMTVGPFCFNSCENCPVVFDPADLVGNWVLAPEAGAYGVGPASGDISWYANSLDDVTTNRACQFDDVVTFGSDLSFSYEMQGSTLVETWQGAAADGCAAPVAPHDGTGSYTYEATASTIKLIGQGAFLGLPKAYNGGELSATNNTAPADITYTITGFTNVGGAKTLTVEVDISAGEAGTAYWTFKYVSQ